VDRRPRRPPESGSPNPAHRIRLTESGSPNPAHPNPTVTATWCRPGFTVSVVLKLLAVFDVTDKDTVCPA
jgi:hypothetical protein